MGREVVLHAHAELGRDLGAVLGVVVLLRRVDGDRFQVEEAEDRLAERSRVAEEPGAVDDEHLLARVVLPQAFDLLGVLPACQQSARYLVAQRTGAPFLAGELPNGMDDNGNGLIDEKGLSFVVDRDSVTIRLTLERVSNDGSVISKTVQSTVTCRNLARDPE